MISPRMLKLFSLLILIGELLSADICTPYWWNFRNKRKRLELSSGLQYFLYKLVSTVVFGVALIISYRLIKVLWLDHVDVFGMCIAICYNSVVWISVCLMLMLTSRHSEFASLVNGTLQLDKILKRVFPDAYTLGLETQQKKIIGFEDLLKFVIVVHCTVNWGLVFTFFQKFDPIHRFCTEYLDLEPEWNMMFLPFAFGEGWFGFMVGHTIGVVAGSIVLYLTSELWMLSLTDILNSQNRATTATTIVDRYSQGKAYLRFYRCQQLLSGLVFQSTATPLMTMHHLCLLSAHIVGNYAILTISPEDSSDSSGDGLLRGFTFLMLIVAYIATYNEVAVLDNFTTAADKFLHSSKRHFGSSAYLRRGFSSCRQLRIWTGYPFFCITSKKFFVTFVKLVFDQTINLKLSLG